jgi:hypothetical protein
MTFVMPANSKAIIRFYCRCVTGATPGQKTQLIGIDAGPKTTVRVMTNTAVLQNADAISYDGGAVALTGTIEYFGLVENLTAAATTFAVQAAQSVSDASNSTFSDGVLEVCVVA